MLKKIAAAAVLAGALAFSAAAPAVLSAGSLTDNSDTSVASGNWPNPMSSKTKDKKTDTTYVTYSGNWPNPM
ncbi:putative low-complexity protein [Pseudarthrobacter defluvii]|uniref:hypothetical protein n=1 Tax=Pseudarthrobacter defluvii TaxID=410837 RepID=UPI002781BD15|nr:hypothetical protein [Pseudarthrobacter defluvii]MDQ0767706.1 putative low-complexity protein [Pseudarthrobacter defluvii]